VNKVAILVILVLLVGIAAAACGGGDGGSVDITDQELIEGILASVDAQETSRFEMDLDGGLKGTMEGEYGEIDLIMDCDGVIDMVDREMQADMSTTMKISAEGEQDEMTIPMRMYFLGDMGYMGAPEGPGQPEEWIKGDMSQELWESQQLLSQQIDFLRGAEVRILRTESVKGTPCYVAEISPDMDALYEMIRSQVGGALVFEPTKDSISDYSATGWYAKDTYFPMRSYVEYEVTFEEGGDRLTGRYTVDMLFYDYNEPVSIQLPPEAEDALYIGPLT